MKFDERLSFILDKPKDEHKLYNHDFKTYGEYYDRCKKECADFIHSLGLKCDNVCWSELNLTRPDTDEILNKIESFCSENNWRLRGGFSQTAVDFESDWYRLYLPFIPDDAYRRDKDILSDRDLKLPTFTITAYKAKNSHLAEMCHKIVASDKFRRVCIENNISGVDFCWLKDVGKFDSQQYFELFFTHNITPVTGLRELNYCENVDHKGEEHEHGEGSYIYEKVHVLGGYLPRLNEMFYDFRIAMQDYFHPDTMPKTGFAYIAERFYPESDEFFRFQIFVHKDTAEILLREKLIQKKWLRPVPITDIVPDGYEKIETIPMGRPKKEYFDAMQAEYEEFIKKPRPKRKATDKDALSCMRKIKTENKEDFNKKMKKDIAESLIGTEYETLTPYYLVADGGYLSNEYRLLPYADTMAATEEFISDMEKEELLEEKPTGVVIATCADGDKVLLCPDKTVIRFPHDGLEATVEWINLAEFIIDAIETE